MLRLFRVGASQNRPLSRSRRSRWASCLKKRAGCGLPGGGAGCSGAPGPPPSLLPPSMLPSSLLFPRTPPRAARRRAPGMPQPLPPTQLYAAERAAVLTSCVLSSLGSGLLVGTHALWPELRTRPRELLLYLSLADLLSALSYFYGVLKDFDRTSWDCVLQGALSTFSNTSSFFWTVAVALYLYVTIVKGSPTGTGLLCCFHIVRWVLWVLRAPTRSLGMWCLPRVPLEYGVCCFPTNPPCLFPTATSKGRCGDVKIV